MVSRDPCVCMSAGLPGDDRLVGAHHKRIGPTGHVSDIPSSQIAIRLGIHGRVTRCFQFAPGTELVAHHACKRGHGSAGYLQIPRLKARDCVIRRQGVACPLPSKSYQQHSVHLSA